MSFLKFFAKLWNAIADLFGRIGPQARRIIAQANQVVERIKNYVDDPKIDVITALIPGNSDDLIVAAARVLLGKVLRVLAFIRDDDFESENEANRAAVLRLKDTGDATANKIIRHGIASALTEAMTKGTDKAIPWSEATALQEHFHKNEAHNIIS